MASELSKIGLPKVDKLCDAKWVKTVFNTSKKEFAQFVEQCSEMSDYMKGIESRIVDAQDEWKDLIRQYLDRVTIKDQANSFKADLKEAERERRRLKKQAEAEAKKQERERLEEEIRAKILAEMEDSSAKEKLEEKAGVIPRKKMVFKKGDIRNRGEDADDSASESVNGGLQKSFQADLDTMEGTRKKVVFKKNGSGESSASEANVGSVGRKMDLATLSAFIQKTAGMGRLGLQDQNGNEVSFAGCSVVKNMIVLEVQVEMDWESILGSMIREGRFKMKNNKGIAVDVAEMSVDSKGKVELLVD